MNFVLFLKNLFVTGGRSVKLVVDTIVNWLNLYLKAEKAMAPHSSTLAWKIPWMEEPGRLQSMGS